MPRIDGEMDKLIFLVSLIVVSVPNAESKIMWDMAYIQVTQGQHVSVTCKVTEIKIFDVVKTVLRKDGKVLEISDNNALKAGFANTGRYRLTTSYDEQAVNVTVEYTGIRGEDGGMLQCYVARDPLEVATVILRVQVPIKAVNLMVIKNGREVEIESGATYDMVQGTESGIVCVVTMDGANEPPDVNITMGETDMTDRFTQTESPVTQWRTSDPIPSVGNTVRYSYVTLDPNKMFNGRQIIFHVTGKLAKLDVHSLNLFVYVFYKPLMCQSSQYFARLGHGYSLACYVRSNPRAVLTYKQLGLHGEYKSLVHNGTRVRETKISNDCTEIGIDIDSVQEEHFGRYIITGMNPYGQGRAEILLKKEWAEETEPLESPSRETAGDPSNSLPKSYQHNSGFRSSSIFKYFLIALSTVTGLALHYRAVPIFYKH